MISLSEVHDGRLCIFERPQEKRIYALGADVAEGIETGDFSTVCILNNDYEQVASWHGHIAPDLFGKLIYHIGKFYNNATAAVEVNNHGLTTITKIRDMEYPNIYSRTVKEERLDKYTKKLGWHTNSKTKAQMLDEFVAFYRDKTIMLRDIALLKEMLSLTIESDGNVNLNGKDRVVSVCIAIQALKQAYADNLGAFNPNDAKPVYKTLEEKLEYFNKRRARETAFE